MDNLRIVVTQPFAAILAAIICATVVGIASILDGQFSWSYVATAALIAVVITLFTNREWIRLRQN